MDELRRIVEHGWPYWQAFINGKMDSWGPTSFQEAAYFGYMGTVRTHLEQGSDVNEEGEIGISVLGMAIYGGQVRVNCQMESNRMYLIPVLLYISLFGTQTAAPPPVSKPVVVKKLTRADFAVYDVVLAAIAKQQLVVPRCTELLEQARNEMSIVEQLDTSQPDVLTMRNHTLPRALALQAQHQLNTVASLAGYKPKQPFGRISMIEAERYHARQSAIFNSREESAAATRSTKSVSDGKFDHFRTIVTLGLPV